MAKGRKLGPSHHERLLGSQHSYGQGQGNGLDNSEFIEEDVWSTADQVAGHEEINHTIERIRQRDNIHEDQRRWATTIEDRHVGGLSLAFEERGKSSSRIIHQFRGQDIATSRHVAASVPVNVPNYPKFLRVDSAESIQNGYEMGYEDDLEWVPPHEYLAHSRTTSATSVLEGVGRTLKGRDMSRVRNAVWSQTGFYG